MDQRWFADDLARRKLRELEQSNDAPARDRHDRARQLHALIGDLSLRWVEPQGVHVRLMGSSFTQPSGTDGSHRSTEIANDE